MIMPITFIINKNILRFRRPNGVMNFHSMTILPFLMLLSLSTTTTLSLADVEMNGLSYLSFGIFMLSLIIMSLLYLRERHMSQYGLIHLFFFSILIGLTAFNSEGDLKNCIYTSLEVYFFLIMCFYYRNRIDVVVKGSALAFSFCIYAGFLHFITHPELWIIVDDKQGTGYMLGNNYNGMGVRMLLALVPSVLCIKYSMKWLFNLVPLLIVCLIPLMFTGSKTSLTGILLFLSICIIPYKSLQKIIINSSLVFIILFQCLVVFAGKGLENNELAVYVIEDVLEKDITFTLRIYLWDTALKVISDSPIWGYGFVNMEWYAHYIRIPSGGMGPHNMILSVLVNGGFILLGLFLLICLQGLRKTYASNERIAICLRAAIVAIMTMLLTEFQSYVFIMFILCMAYYYPEIQESFNRPKKQKAFTINNK